MSAVTFRVPFYANNSLFERKIVNVRRCRCGCWQHHPNKWRSRNDDNNKNNFTADNRTQNRFIANLLAAAEYEFIAIRRVSSIFLPSNPAHRLTGGVTVNQRPKKWKECVHKASATERKRTRLNVPQPNLLWQRRWWQRQTAANMTTQAMRQFANRFHFA